MLKSRSEKKPEAKKPKTPLQRIWNIVTGILVTLVAALAVALVGLRLFGFTPYSVLSPSMAPVYQTGDLVYVREVPPEELEAGDVITYVASGSSVFVTHRIDEIDSENERIYTKGDANDSRDAAPVAYENVVGKVVFSLPKLGYISTYLSTESGRYAALACLFLAILLLILPPAIRKLKNDRSNEL